MPAARDNKSQVLIELTFCDLFNSVQGPPPQVHRLNPQDAGPYLTHEGLLLNE